MTAKKTIDPQREPASTSAPRTNAAAASKTAGAPAQSRLELELAVTNEHVRFLEERCADLTENLRTARRMATLRDELVVALTEDLAGANARLDSLEEALRQTEQDLADARKRLRALQNENSRLEGEFGTAHSERASTDARASEITLLKDEVTHLREIYARQAQQMSSRKWLVKRLVRSIVRRAQASAAPGLPSPPNKGVAPQVPIAAPVRSAADFDVAWYCAAYPDVLANDLDPLWHYENYGRTEGRLGRPPALQIHLRGFDESKDTIALVTHDMSRTGAPILVFNLLERLAEKYNVVLFSPRSGSLYENFRKAASMTVVGGIREGAPPLGMTYLLRGKAGPGMFKYAILNSAESREYLALFEEWGVPVVSVIHEFASYTRPSNAFQLIARKSAQVVFSSRLVLENALEASPLLKGSATIPQGQCAIPPNLSAMSGEGAREGRRLEGLRAGLDPDTLVVLGAGFVHIRKGVDLFIQVAGAVAKRTKRPVRFVWLGDGYDPEGDVNYSLYLQDEIKRLGLEDVVEIHDAVDNLHELYGQADVFLMSSRLDPLPNVAIDAFFTGLPVVCFADTTGIAEYLERSEDTRPLVVPYLDTAAAGEIIARLAEDAEFRQRASKRVRSLADLFDFRTYADNIDRVGQKAAELERDAELILADGRFDPKFFGGDGPALSDREAAQLYLRQGFSELPIRKPFPGFSLLEYLESQKTRDGQPVTEPLVDLIRHGTDIDMPRNILIPGEDMRARGGFRPQGGGARSGDKEPRAALHIHCYYPDLLPGMLERIERNAARPDLYLTVVNEAAANSVRDMAASYDGKADIRLMPNIGRDIGPFLSIAGALEGYEIIGHCHTKKSLVLNSKAMVDSWMALLLENVLGGEYRMIDFTLAAFARDPGAGLIYPEDPHIVGWTENRGIAETLMRQADPDYELPDHIDFPVGNMFWARRAAMAPLFDLKLTPEDLPSEPAPYDGTVLHALERLTPHFARSAGYSSLRTFVPGFVR